MSRSIALHASPRNKNRGLRARLGVLPLERVEADRLSKSDRHLVGSTLNLTKRRPAYARNHKRQKRSQETEALTGAKQRFLSARRNFAGGRARSRKTDPRVHGNQ